MPLNGTFNEQILDIYLFYFILKKRIFLEDRKAGHAVGKNFFPLRDKMTSLLCVLLRFHFSPCHAILTRDNPEPRVLLLYEYMSYRSFR